jgi:hypothetical protein
MVTCRVLAEVKVDVENWKRLMEQVQTNINKSDADAQQLAQRVTAQTDALHVLTKESEESGLLINKGSPSPSAMLQHEPHFNTAVYTSIPCLTTSQHTF